MATDDERREVARRLRRKHGERSCDFVGQCMGLQLQTMTADIRDCIPEGETLLVLADLIDPDLSRNVPEFDSKAGEGAIAVKELTVDREALLALADEMAGGFLLFGSTKSARRVFDFLSDKLGEYARRIREACGEAGR